MGKKKQITLREVFTAMQDDPTPKTTGYYIALGAEGDNAPRCAIGGAAFVLGLDPDDLGSALDTITIPDKDEDSWDNSAWDWIVTTNDDTKVKKATVGRRALKRFEKVLDRKLTVRVG